MKKAAERAGSSPEPYRDSRFEASCAGTIRAHPSPHQPGPDPMTHRTGPSRTSLAAAGLSFARRLAAAAAIVLTASPLAHGADPKVLNIYNWSDYIADDTIKNFEKETGIKVNYDNYDSNEVLLAKLVAGNTGYDIVVPGAHFAKTQIEGGLLQKLDRAKLSNWSNLDPTLLKQLAVVDPGNQYLVDWLWGYVTVGINVPKVKAALGDLPMPDNAWSLIFDPKYASKLKGCGVNFLDSASEVLPVALLYVGKKPYSTNADDYDAAAKMLQSVRPYVTRFSSSGYINDLAGGSLCAVMGYSGDINIARARASRPARSSRRRSRRWCPRAARRCSSIRWRFPRTPRTSPTRTSSSTTSCAPMSRRR
jgi:putrescine transport system substrate-binding protein